MVEMIEYPNESFSRNSSYQTQPFPFELIIPLPPSRVARLIITRDGWGRMIFMQGS